MAQYALVVGIESFQSSLTHIAFAENDANAFVNVLIDSFYIPYENIKYLPNVNATLESINDAILEICNMAVKGDRVILYLRDLAFTLRSSFSTQIEDLYSLAFWMKNVAGLA